MIKDIEKRFNDAMWSIHRRAYKEAAYNAKRFLKMLDEHGGLGTAKILINAPKVSEGYTALYLRGRLDLTVEAEIYDNPRWNSLFTQQELDIVRIRLIEYEYGPALESS